MSATVEPHVDEYAEQAVLGAAMLVGDSRIAGSLLARGLRQEHFASSKHAVIYGAIISLADRQAGIDFATVWAELDRQGHAARMQRAEVEYITAFVPATGNHGDYADRVIELAQWRSREKALRDMQTAATRRDAAAWGRAAGALEVSTAGTRTDSLSGEQLRSVMFDYFAKPPESVAAQAVPFPFERINEALGGGLKPGEVCLLSGPTSHGKSLVADMWADHAAKHGKQGHIYMTEMTFEGRVMRYLARQTGVPFRRQRLPTRMTDDDRVKVMEELNRGPLPYGMSVVSDWTIDDVVRDALRAQYDYVIVDLLHGFHYEDERGLDRLSKAMQRLARVSTLQDGHPGTAVIPVTHLKEEGTDRKGKVQRPTIASLKGGSSLKQDTDAICFVWQEQNERAEPTGEGEIWLAKGRGMEMAHIKVSLNPGRFRFELRGDDDMPIPAVSAPVKQEEMPF